MGLPFFSAWPIAPLQLPLLRLVYACRWFADVLRTYSRRYTFDGDKTNGTVAGQDSRDVTRVYSASRATHEELGSFGRSVSEEQARGVAQTLVEGLHTGLVFIN